MTEIINQQELDTLLSSLEMAERSRRPGSQAATAALYDFRYASKLSPDNMRSLQGRLTALVNVLNRTMSLYLNTDADFRVHSLDVTGYDQYLRNLAVDPILGVISFGTGSPPALWEISAPLAYAALDCMLGGTGRTVQQQAAEATPIEKAILRRLFQEILSAWMELWDRLEILRPQVETVVTSHAKIGVAGDDRLFSAMLESTMASTRGMIRLCLPLGVVKRLLRDEREAVSATELTPTSPSLPIAEPLADTPVSVRAYLQVPSVPLNELLHLEPGTEINLRLPANEPFHVCIGEVDKFVARAGTANGRTALQLLGETEADN